MTAPCGVPCPVGCQSPTLSSTPCLTQADSEFDNCLRRRGEALSLFLNEEPTFSYLPLAYYYQGRARQNFGTAGFRDSYRQYLQIRGTSTEDPLLADVRTRAGL